MDVSSILHSLFKHCVQMLVLFLAFVCFSRSNYRADAYVFQFFEDCEFIDNIEDLVYIQRYVFNRMETIYYDTNIKKHVGYTEYGIRNAERFNEDKDQMAALLATRDRYCKHNAEVFRASTLDRRIPPSVKVSSNKLLSSKHPTMLVCQVTGFFPQQINVTWLRDGLETKTDVTSTDLLANGDWTYQVHSHLELTPRAGETVACRVEHSSLERPLEVTWDPSMPESKKNKIVIGVSGLILGLIITAAGVIYYKKKSSGRILVPSD